VENKNFRSDGRFALELWNKPLTISSSNGNPEVMKALYDYLIRGEGRPNVASELFVSDRVSFDVFLAR